MRSYFLTALYLASTAIGSSAQTNQAKVRAVIHLPHIGVQFNIAYDPPEVRCGAPSLYSDSPAAQLSALQKLLHGTPADAAVYVQMAESYPAEAPGSAAKITDSYTKAANLFRKQVVKSPRDSWISSQLGDALCGAGSSAEGEKLLRQAVIDAPNDWRCWVNLGNFLLVASVKQALHNEAVTTAQLSDIVTLSGLLQPLTKRQGLDKDAETFAISQKEARNAYDRAVKAAPSVPGPYERRFAFGFVDTLLTQSIHHIALGEEPDNAPAIPNSILSDEWTAAELNPNNARLQYGCLVLAIRSNADKLSSDKPNDLSTGLGKLPAGVKDKVAHGITRLSKCADAADHVKAATALVDLASAYFLLSDLDDATGALVRAVALDPGNDQAAEGLIAMYLAAKRYKELATLLEDQINRQDTPYRRLCLSHVYGSMGNRQGVSEQIISGLKTFPDDLLLNLAFAAGLMKVNDPDVLKQAGDVISLAQTIYDKLPDKDRKANQANFDVSRAIYLALIGKPDVARLALERVLNDDPNNEEAKEALGAIEAQ